MSEAAIPAGWDRKPIKAVAKIATGDKDTKDRVDNGLYPFFVRSQTVERINSVGFDGEGVLTAGDGVGTGKIFHYINGKCDFHQRVYLMHSFSEGVTGRYFFYYFSHFFYDRIMAMTAKSSVDSVRREMIADMEILFPNDSREQERVVAALSDADGVVAGLERVIAKKRLIKQGAMQDLLTARRRLPGFSGEWEVKRLGAALTVRHGRSQKEVEHPAGEFPILATGGQIGTATKFLCDKPSVLIGRKGTIDAPRFMDKPFWSVDTLFYTDVHTGFDAKFLFYVFLMVDWMSYNEASGVPSLNAKTIENIEVSIPKFDEQQAIAAVLSDMDAEIQTLESRLAKARAVKEGMMQNLLTGRVRLV